MLVGLELMSQLATLTSLQFKLDYVLPFVMEVLTLMNKD